MSEFLRDGRAVFISVFRDAAMYRRCLGENPHTRGCEFHAIDNREENAHVSVQYNRFLDAYDYAEPAWLVFCHEDFEPLESLAPHLAKADPGALHGPIGAWTKTRCGCFHAWRLAGTVIESAKDGTSEALVGTAVSAGTRVDTFDCQCLIVHSGLIAQTGLRFDPELSFDLYVEDFCIQAHEQHGISSQILPFACKHWSHGNVGARYLEQERYLRRKYPKSCYTGTSTYDIGTPGVSRWLNSAVKATAKRWLAAVRTRRPS